MTLQKIEFEYDIPDGYRFVRYGKPKIGDVCLLYNKQILVAECNYDFDEIIVEKISEQEQPKLKLQYKTQQGDWRDVIDGYEYRIKPKTKTVRFRSYLDRYFGTVKVVRSGVPSDLGTWLGDWQEVEVEE